MRHVHPVFATVAILLVPSAGLGILLRTRHAWPVARVQRLLAGLTGASGLVSLVLVILPNFLRDAVTLAAAAVTAYIVRRLRRPDGQIPPLQNPDNQDNPDTARAPLDLGDLCGLRDNLRHLRHLRHLRRLSGVAAAAGAVLRPLLRQTDTKALPPPETLEAASVSAPQTEQADQGETPRPVSTSIPEAKPKPAAPAPKQPGPTTPPPAAPVVPPAPPAPPSWLDLALVLLVLCSGDPDPEQARKRILRFFENALHADKSFLTQVRQTFKTRLKGLRKSPPDPDKLAAACRTRLAYAPRLALIDLAFRLLHDESSRDAPDRAAALRLTRHLARDLGLVEADLTSIAARHLPRETPEEAATRLALERVRRHREEKERLLRDWQDLQWQTRPGSRRTSRRPAPGPEEIRALALLGFPTRPENGQSLPRPDRAALAAARDRLALLYTPGALAPCGPAITRLADEQQEEIEAAWRLLAAREDG